MATKRHKKSQKTMKSEGTLICANKHKGKSGGSGTFFVGEHFRYATLFPTKNEPDPDP